MLNLLEDEMSITYVEVCDTIKQFNNIRSAYVHTPHRDMLPHHRITNNDVILLIVLIQL